MLRSLMGMALVVMAYAVTETAAAQAPTTDPMVGTWKLNVARSTFSPGPAPRSSVYRYENLPDGFTRYTSISEDASGNPTFSMAHRKYDGREYPRYNTTTLAAFIATGARPNQTEASRLIDAYTTELINRTDGRVLTTITRTMSRDGRTFTLRSTGTNAAGQPVNDVAIYEKVGGM